MGVYSLSAVCVAVALCVCAVAADPLIVKVSRDLDVSGKLLSEKTAYTFRNSGEEPLSTLTLAISGPGTISNLEVELRASGARPVDVTGSLSGVVCGPKAKPGSDCFELPLSAPLAPGSEVSVVQEVSRFDYYTPFPAKIDQSAHQKVVIETDAIMSSVYPVLSQRTKVSCGGSIDSFSKGKEVEPVSRKGKVVTYGPYEGNDISDSIPIRVHVDNNDPPLIVTGSVRTVIVSHWNGELDSTETFQLSHTGAGLVSGFSRKDYMAHRNTEPMSVEFIRRTLPSSATDLYYRDTIGNISTSTVYEHDEENALVMQMRPRFPLFGGWKTDFKLGFSVPASSSVMALDGGRAMELTLPLAGFLEEAIIARQELRIVLPEGSEDVEVSLPKGLMPFNLEGPLTTTTTYSYLDTLGRPTVVVPLLSLNPDDHYSMEVKVTYSGPGLAATWRKPVVLSISVFLIFGAFMVASRCSLSIRGSFTRRARMLTGLHDEANQALDAAFAAFKETKDSGAYEEAAELVEAQIGAMARRWALMRREAVEEKGQAASLQLDATEDLMSAVTAARLELHRYHISRKTGNSSFVEETTALMKKVQGAVTALAVARKALRSALEG